MPRLGGCALALAVVAGCSLGPGTSDPDYGAAPARPQRAAGFDTEVVRLAVLVDLSGPVAERDRAYLAGVETYWSQANARGGVAGRFAVELEVVDVGASPTGAVDYLAGVAGVADDVAAVAFVSDEAAPAVVAAATEVGLAAAPANATLAGGDNPLELALGTPPEVQAAALIATASRWNGFAPAGRPATCVVVDDSPAGRAAASVVGLIADAADGSVRTAGAGDLPLGAEHVPVLLRLGAAAGAAAGDLAARLLRADCATVLAQTAEARAGEVVAAVGAAAEGDTNAVASAGDGGGTAGGGPSVFVRPAAWGPQEFDDRFLTVLLLDQSPPWEAGGTDGGTDGWAAAAAAYAPDVRFDTRARLGYLSQIAVHTLLEEAFAGGDVRRENLAEVAALLPEVAGRAAGRGGVPTCRLRPGDAGPDDAGPDDAGPDDAASASCAGWLQLYLPPPDAGDRGGELVLRQDVSDVADELARLGLSR